MCACTDLRVAEKCLRACGRGWATQLIGGPAQKTHSYETRLALSRAVAFCSLTAPTPGCSAAPHPPGTVWPCQGHSVCSDPSSQHVLYGWAKDAPPASVPDGAAFRVGAGSGTRSLVLQVHYSHRRPPGDKSGVRLNLTSTHVPFSAGLTMWAHFFSVPPPPTLRRRRQLLLPARL